MKKDNYLEKSKSYKGFHYSEIDPKKLEYLHKRCLEMLKIVVEILYKNNIKFMICGGTLLGAMTTKKFIPWDDDVDVCVFEEDYGKMIDCLIRDLPDGISIQCNRTEDNYYLDWVKVRDKKSKIFPGVNKFKENGVWIDIYMLKLIKGKHIAYRIEKNNLNYLKKRYNNGGLTKKEYVDRLKKNKFIKKMIIEKIKHFFSFKNNYMYVIWSASKITLNKEWVLPLKEYEFEGLKITSFNNAHAYLKNHYGNDYIKLPSDDLRRISINKIQILNN
jgi:lipopolysaccharide cholinephosphotransferase